MKIKPISNLLVTYNFITVVAEVGTN